MNKYVLRFMNFIIDTTIYLIGMIIVVLLFQNIIAEEFLKWMSLAVYLGYYFISEYFFGRTIGKLITKTKVKSLVESSDYYFLQILIRTTIRVLPIDIISYLFGFRGLHDWISKTTIYKL
nr:RDD family protein [uncultured Draconibacterium sp.]